ncbi:MAG: alpha/beta fold hydrolase [Chthoniobacterales bacterium]
MDQYEISGLTLMRSYFFVALLLSITWISFSQAIPEENYYQDYAKEVIHFLKNHQKTFSFPSWDQCYMLSAVRMLHAQDEVGESSAGIIIFLEGVKDSWFFEGETFYDLFQKGYDIYAYDHRGQGCSPHLSDANPQISHIEHFSDYTKDFKNFVDLVRAENPGRPLFLVAHSLGGAIAAEYLENETASPFTSVVLLAPMFEINFSRNGKNFTEQQVLFDVSWHMKERPSTANKYAYSKEDGDVDPKTWDEETDNPRLAQIHQLCKEKPEVIVGGPSNKWLQEAINSSRHIRSQTNQINCNTLILVPENDQIVVRAATQDASKKMPQATYELVEGASHPLLQLSNDRIRNEVLDRIDSFFATGNVANIAH